MRQLHVAASDKLCIDSCGLRLQVVKPDTDTGEVREAEVFVAILGASNYTNVKAFPSQKEVLLVRGACECFRALRWSTTALGS